MDFETAVRERIPILSILLNNFSMAIELPIMQTATEKYRSHRHQRQLRRHGEGVRRLRRARHRARARSSRRIKRGIAKTQEGTPALLEFITEKEINFSMFK